MSQLGIINEVGDFGLGFNTLTEKEKEFLAEKAAKEGKKEKTEE